MKIRVVTFGLLLVLLIGILVSLWTAWTVQEAQKSALAELQFTTERNAGFIGHALRAIELVIKTTSSHIEVTGKSEGLRPYLKQLVARLTPVRTITVTGPDGIIHTDLRPGEPAKGYKVSDRAYFRVHTSPNSAEEYFYSPPIRSRLDGLTQITLSVAARRANGDLLAVVASSIDDRFFTELKQELEIIGRYDARILYEDGNDVYILHEVVPVGAKDGIVVNFLARLFNGSKALHRKKIAVAHTNLSFQITLPAVSYLTEASPRVVRGSLMIGLILLLMSTAWWLAYRGRTQIIASEKRFKDFAETTSDFFWEMDRDLRFSYFSEHFKKITNVPPTALLGKTRAETGIPDIDPRVWAAHLDDLKDHRGFYNFVHPQTIENGNVVWLSISGKPIFDADGVFHGYRCTGTDITERKRVEEELENSEARLRRSVLDAPIPVIMHAEDGEVLMLSKKWQELSGYSHSDIPTVQDWIEKAYRGDEKNIEAQRERINDFYNIEESTKNEAYVTMASGEKRTWEVHNAPLGQLPDGRRFIISMALDLTERKKAEETLLNNAERFRSAFETVAVGNIVINDRGIIEIFNAAATHIFGYSADEIIGQNVSILMPEPNRTKHDGYIKNYLETGEAKIIGKDREVTGLRKNGEKFPMHLGIGKMRMGDTVSFVGSISDLSKMKTLESQLAQAQKMEAVGQLTGGMAHDFNNLLAIILGNLEILDQMSKKDAEFDESLAEAIKAVERGSKLTYQLLAFSRQQALDPETIEVNSMLFDTIELFTRTLGEDIDIKSAFGTGVDLINVDHGMLGNAILNLALNSRHAMPRGGTMMIKTSNVDLKGRTFDGEENPVFGPHVLVSVIDSGVGIRKKDMKHVFEPFFTTRDVGEGSGLGLSMVYGFVKQSGGHVSIDSKRGKGTTVNLYFPIAEGLSKGSNTKAVPSEFEVTGMEAILVVEDEESVRNIIVKILTSLGYQVLEAEDGGAAIKVLEVLKSRGMKIDLVFSDVIMPGGMSGIELAQEVQRHYQGIKVVLTSGYPDRVTGASDFKKTDIDLLAKPYRRDQLARKLRGVLDQ